MKAQTAHLGRVFKYGDNVNTDVIFPGKYTYTVTEPSEMAKHALEDLDPSFIHSVRRGDIIVAGKNFGCGSSREQAATCLVELGVYAIVAKSFARIYFRNAINLGLPVIVCADAVDAAEGGEEISIDFEQGTISVKNLTFTFPAFPMQVKGILDAGGLLNYAKLKLNSAV